MNGLTILLWVTIFIIGLIAIIGVKLHYKGAELEKDEKPIISAETFNGIISYGQDTISNTAGDSQNLSAQHIINNDYPVNEIADEKSYTSSEVENVNYGSSEYESQNQVLITYGNEVEKFQEPTTEGQVEIMTPDNEKHELKDLFTIDELIKESKRKDSEREKESQKITNDDDKELTELKESIINKKENDNVEESLIEEILADEEIGELLETEEVAEEPKAEPTIQEIIDNVETQSEETSPASEESIQDVLDVGEAEEPAAEEVATEESEVTAPSEIEAPSQKDIAEAIDNASQEIEEEEIEIGSDSDNITDVLLNSEDKSEEEEIKEPVLKSPTKIDDTQSTLGETTSNSSLYGSEPENDLDYRKDLAKITNTIKGSKLFQDVKSRITGENEPETDPVADLQETYIRNVNDFEEEEYDEYAPIINETHDEFGEEYEPEQDYDQAIREENTRRLFNNVRKAPEPELAIPKAEPIKPKPSRGSIKIQMGNADVVLKKGDEIIFRYDGDTYSSQVYAINGDDISVRYRRKDITIKPSDVKKIY